MTNKEAHIGAIVLGHGTLGVSIFDALKNITENVENIEPLSMPEVPGQDIENILKKGIDKVHNDKGVIIFTDMLGGTPTNVALKFYEENKIEVITGVNLPLLLRFVNKRDKMVLNELVADLLNYAREAVHTASDMLKDNK